jgi:[ribosomal protein S5]-alanine N-acetyltransferase
MLFMPALISPAMPAGSLAAGPQPVVAAGDGMWLRPWRLTDAGAVIEAYQDREIQRWHVRQAGSLAEARRWIEGWQACWPAETAGHWAVASRADDRVLGRVALKSLDLADGTAVVAYWMMPAARGAGLCTQAVRQLARWALDRAGFHRLELEHSIANVASCRVAAKAGFAGEGIRRSAALHADGWHDMHRHARIGAERPVAGPPHVRDGEPGR